MASKVLIFLTISGLAFGQPWEDRNIQVVEFYKTPMSIWPFTLTCEVELSNFATVVDMRIEKKINRGYTGIADANIMLGLRRNSVMLGDLEVDAVLGPNAYLEVTWPDVPREETFGTYQCVFVIKNFYTYRYVQSYEMEVGSARELMERIRELVDNGDGDGGGTQSIEGAGAEELSDDTTTETGVEEDVGDVETGGGQTGGEQTGGEQTGREQTGGEQTGGQQTGGEQTGGDQAGATNEEGTTSGVPQDEIDALNDRINDIEDQVNAAQGTQGNTDDFQASVDSVNQQITDAQTASQESPQFTDRISALAQQIESLRGSTQTATDLLNRINALRQQIVTVQTSAQTLSDLNGQVTSMTQDVSGLIEAANKTIIMDDPVEDLADQVDDLEDWIDSMTDDCHLRSLIWPQGRYSLLMPRTGCPTSDLVAWPSGNRTHFTETSSGDNQNDNSTADHMPLNLFTRDVNGNYMATLSFCTHIAVEPGIPTWPRGSYCLHRRNNRCPGAAFTVGQLTIDDEEGPNLNRRAGTLPGGRFSRNSVYYYCCRNDSSADQEVVLPTETPFYLYRYGGKCQEVHSMSVTNDYIVIDTSNDKRRGSRANYDQVVGTVPDGEINNVRLELCYYRPY